MERRLTSGSGPLAHGPPVGKRARLRAVADGATDHHFKNVSAQATKVPPSRRERARRLATRRWDTRRASTAVVVATAACANALAT
eukprot:1792615-Pleurochrysis_carterae.AAC.1